MHLRKIHAIALTVLAACTWGLTGVSSAQGVPSPDQLNQLVAPIALYPDTLLAQICAASGDPQQIIDADNWMKQNSNLQGQALTDAAQAQGFDPAFISLVNFPSVLDMMAAHVDDYAALGAAFKADQASVMSAIQTLRQQAYASGALDSNQYQTVSVQPQNGTQVVVIQPANPQVVYVPQYQPAQVYIEGPSAGDIVAASLISFGAGIAIGALINDSRPWGWHSWGWGWGGRGLIYRRSVWGFSYRYRSLRPYYRPRPPRYDRPIHARPPPNWSQRPGYRPPRPDLRPGGPNPGGGRPVSGGGARPPSGNAGGNRPPTTGGGTRPPSFNPGGNRPSSSKPLPATGGAVRPSVKPGGSRPPSHNPFAGFPQGGNHQQQPQRPQPTPQSTGARPGAFGGNNNGGAARAASNRGKESAEHGHRPGGSHP
jgi:Protein of unknown function (DUF3300)